MYRDESATPVSDDQPDDVLEPVQDDGEPDQEEAQEPDSDDGEPDQEAPRQRRDGLQARMSELTRRRYEAERRAAEAEERLAQMERQSRQPAGRQPTEFAAPSPADYAAGEFDPGYIRDQAAHAAQLAVSQHLDRMQRAQAEQARAREAGELFAALPRDTAQMLQRMAEGSRDLSGEMATFLIENRDDQAVLVVAQHLAANPDEARAIRMMPPSRQLIAMSKLAAQAAQALTASTRAPPANRVPQTGRARPSYDYDKMTQSQYERLVREGKIK